SLGARVFVVPRISKRLVFRRRPRARACPSFPIPIMPILTFFAFISLLCHEKIRLVFMPHRSFFIFLVVFQALTFGVWAKPYSGHGRQSVSPTLLQRFAPTPLPDALTRRIQSALDLRPTGLGMLSEDGKNLYFTWAITGTSQAW